MNPMGDSFWLYNGIAVLMYGIFFFVNPDGNNFYSPTTSCYVVSDQSVCLSKEEAAGGGTNMTVRYQLLMGFGFTFSFLALTSIIYLETWMKGVGQQFIAMIDAPLSFIWIITLIICRSIHSGSVVSGNNCSDPRGCTSEHGYLPYTSKFILGWFISVLLVPVILLVYIKYKTQKKNEADGTAISPLNSNYLAKYEHIGDEPLGRGACGTAWKVKVKGSTDEKVYVAKETVGDPILCKATFCPEQRALAKINHPKIVNMIESFGEGESGSVMIIDFMKG